MNVAVFGATGVLGSRVVARLRERGHEVRLLVRDTRVKRGRLPSGTGVCIVVGDILDPSAVHACVASADVVLHLATALAADGAGVVDWAANDAVRRAGTANIVAACAAHGTRRLVAQSVAFVDQASARLWSDGTEGLQARPFLASAVQLETCVRAAATPSVILRGGLFYGPGTALSESWRRATKTAPWHVPANGDEFVSFVHVADMASAVVMAAEADTTGTYAVVDDRPLTWSDVAAALSPPMHAGRAGRDRFYLSSFRVRNRAFRQEFGWTPAFPSMFVGLAEEPWWQADTRGS